MAIFEWNDSLSVGIQEIDNQHRELIKKLNILAEYIQQKKGKDKIGTTLRFMKDYSKIHFDCEEEHMAKYEYPGLEKQKREHEKFKATAEKLIRDLEKKKDMELFASQVQRFLIDWLILHIKSVDKKFGEFLEGNNLLSK
jgi:hemerythrin